MSKLKSIERPVAVAAVPSVRPSREAAEAAVRTLLAWAGDDPNRPGLKDTPRRVVEAYEDYFSGYREDARDVLASTFDEAAGYRDMVMLRDVRVMSHCEHHVAPFTGKAAVAYIPNGRIVGLSRLARLVDVYSRRLQTQENLTVDIAGAIERELRSSGVAVAISAEHTCMSMRGSRHAGVATITTEFRGRFADDTSLRDRFLGLAGLT